MSTYSNLKIELITTGDQTGAWGATTNTNLGTALEEAIIGSATVTFASADVTLTLINANTTQQARNYVLNLTGTSGGARNLILGSGCQISKPYLIINGLADTVTVKNTTGSGVAVPAGTQALVYNNATNVVSAINYIPSVTLGSAVIGSLTGLLKASSGTVSVATSGTDYAPATSGSAILYGNGSGGFSNVTVGTGLSFSGGTLISTVSPGSGTVTSVSGTGTINGLTLSGTVTTSGSLTLSGAVTSLTTTNFTVQESGGKLIIKYGGTTLFSIDSSGNMTTIANVTAYGTP
jgi:hypothetical protein